MKIERVSYQKIFPLGQYINEKIGVDILVNDGDDPMELLKKASEMVHEFHSKNEQSFPVDTPVPVMQLQRVDNSTDIEFQKVKSKLEAAKKRGEALDILEQSGFRYHKELKQIAESKPTK
jgi:hypothetical protein